MNPVGLVLALGAALGVAWWLSQQTRFFAHEGGVSYWPGAQTAAVKAKLDKMVATPLEGQERVWVLSPSAPGMPTALTTVLLIQGRGNRALVPKVILALPPGGTTLMSEVTPAEAASFAPASQDDVGVLL